MKILFVCNQNKNRSKTAEEMFKDRFETKSAGLFNDNPINEKDMTWADVIIVMEDFQRKEIAERFPKSYLQKRILSLNVPDIYSYNQHELFKILDQKMKEVEFIVTTH